MMTPSLARHLVSGATPFYVGHTNWRVTYSFRKDTYTFEARSTCEIIGALSFPSVSVVQEAIKVLKYACVYDLPLEHPLACVFDYDFDSYEYNPNMDNYGILKDAYTDTYCLNISRGVVAVGALHFPKDIAKDYIRKLNSGAIIL